MGLLKEVERAEKPRRTLRFIIQAG